MNQETQKLLAQFIEVPVVRAPGSTGCFYCGSQTHAMAVPERVADWNPGPLCYPSPGCR